MDKVEEQILIKNRLLSIMAEKKYSENQLAKNSGIRQSTINKILSQGSIPRVDTLHALCNGLDISLNNFFDFPPFNDSETKKDVQSKSKLDEDFINMIKSDIKKELKKELLEEIKKEAN